MTRLARGSIGWLLPAAILGFTAVSLVLPAVILVPVTAEAVANEPLVAVEIAAVNGYRADDVLATMRDRMLNDYETERKIVRNELARINRTRLERMLGPEGGYDNW